MKLSISLLFIFFLLMLTFPVFASEYPCSDCYGDAIITGTIGEPSVLLPLLASDSASHDVTGLIFNGLVKYDPDLILTGDLAESWNVSEDGLVITFHLNRDVKWHDGVQFTAHDVMFGYKTIIDPGVPTAYSGDFLQVEKAEVIDDFTFRVTYRRPFAPALGSWGSLPVLPRHLLEDKEITQSPLCRNPVGVGPFKLVRWLPGEKLILEANPSYFEGRPFLNNYVFRFIPDSSTLFLELKAGSIDMMGLTPLQFSRQTDTAYFKNNFNKYRYPVHSYTYLGFNLLHPWFQDKRVRQAIAHAIDKQELIDGVLLGLGNISTGPYIPGTWPHNPSVKHYEYNTDKALKLLAEAGWTDPEGSGTLKKDGTPFEFTILTNMGNPLRLKTATIIQWRLSMIGIKVNIRVVEWATFINEFIDKRRFQAVILGWSIGLDPDQHDIWHSSKTSEKELNFVSYINPEVDRLFEEGRSTFDIKKRKAAYHRIHEILAEDVPYVFLYVPDALPIIHKRFKNIKPTPLGIRYNLNQWYVPKHMQKHKVIP